MTLFQTQHPDMANTEKEKARVALTRCCTRTCARVCAAGVMLLSAACSDEPASDAPIPAQPAAAAQFHAHALEWLKQTDPVTADVWLASREAGQDLDVDDPAVLRMHQLIDTATTRFRDQPRMVANRAVQLEAMLREKGIDESASSIIATLCEVPRDTRYIESFSALTQQYYNLRRKGLGRSQTIAALRHQNDPN
ncbi:MAG: hypothetical protein WC829_17460 [Hyphomicrobium sp.]